MHTFQATLDIIGVNPFVFVPEPVLQAIFEAAGKNKGPVRVRGSVNGQPFTQTLVRFSGHWRLYINLVMLKNSPHRIGEVLDIQIAYNPEARETYSVPAFTQALAQEPAASAVFESLSQSRKEEIVRYLFRLKSQEVLEKNVIRAIEFLKGNGRFVGRDKP
jgi:hypothetical protein